MFDRSRLWVLLCLSLLLPFAGCNSTQVDSITVSPSTQNVATGGSVQFTATATVGHAGHPPQNVTDSVTWTSSDTSVATISATGLATGVSGGTATITASESGYGGLVSSTATLTVTGGGGTKGSVLTSLSIIPGSQSVSAPGQTTQFLAIGTTSTNATVNETDLVSWSTSSSSVAKISFTGLATGVSQGTTTITAIATNSDGTVVTGTATFTVTGGTSEPFTAITVSPNAQTISATGQTAQLIALGTSGSNGLNEDVTNSSQVTWSSSVPSVATVSTYPASPAGLVTGKSVGNTTITAKLTNPDGTVYTSSAVITTQLTGAPEPLLSLTIIPTSATVGNLGDTAQFVAIGTFATSPTVQDLTNSPNLKWFSTFPDDFPINNTGVAGAQAGLITAEAAGTDVVIAEATNPDGSVATATALFSCPLVLPNPPLVAGSCYPGSEAPSLLSTLTVFNAGVNTTDWLVTASSATGTPDVIHCGPGSTAAKLGTSVCVATYPVGTTVTLTAPAGAGKFGGWSSNCTEIGTITAAGPNTCTVVLSTDDTVGAIFN